MPAPTIAWLVRYVDDGTLKVRTFQTQEAAELFMRRVRDDPQQEFRSWAEVRTAERPRPGFMDEGADR
jgi:hypothetical protein